MSKILIFDSLYNSHEMLLLANFPYLINMGSVLKSIEEVVF